MLGLVWTEQKDVDAQRNIPKKKRVSQLPCTCDLIPVKKGLKSYFGFRFDRIKPIMERKAWWKRTRSQQECVTGPPHLHLDVTGSRKLTGSSARL